MAWCPAVLHPCLPDHTARVGLFMGAAMHCIARAVSGHSEPFEAEVLHVCDVELADILECTAVYSHALLG